MSEEFDGYESDLRSRSMPRHLRLRALNALIENRRCVDMLPLLGELALDPDVWIRRNAMRWMLISFKWRHMRHCLPETTKIRLVASLRSESDPAVRGFALSLRGVFGDHTVVEDCRRAIASGESVGSAISALAELGSEASLALLRGLWAAEPPESWKPLLAVALAQLGSCEPRVYLESRIAVASSVDPFTMAAGARIRVPAAMNMLRERLEATTCEITVMGVVDQFFPNARVNEPGWVERMLEWPSASKLS